MLLNKGCARILHVNFFWHAVSPHKTHEESNHSSHHNAPPQSAWREFTFFDLWTSCSKLWVNVVFTIRFGSSVDLKRQFFSTWTRLFVNRVASYGVIHLFAGCLFIQGNFTLGTITLDDVLHQISEGCCLINAHAQVLHLVPSAMRISKFNAFTEKTRAF